jgi:antitoxin component YwqK of YwqJK toxin-antitoxin module
MIKLFLIALGCFLSVFGFSQEKPIIKYYDSLWSPTSKAAAFYYTEFIKHDSIYNCCSYWAETKKLYCKSIYADTLFSKPRGLLLRFYENGQVQDSSYFYENGEVKNTYHYYQSGKLWAHYSYDKQTRKGNTEGFDEQGHRIKHLVYMKEAEFQGGNEAWLAFLSKNLNTNTPIRNHAPLGVYHVIITFMIDKKGNILNSRSETNFGYGMEDEAMRVIRKSPPWSPAILLGEAKTAYRLQPVTFMVSAN